MSWTVTEAELPFEDPDTLSTVFTVGNGAACTRGTPAEQRFEAFRGVYVSGLYTRAGYGLIYFMQAPDWLPVVPTVGGTPMDCAASERELDMHRGVLTRRATFTGGGTTLRLIERRFASLARPGLMAQQVEVERVEGGEVELLLALDGEVRSHPAKYYTPGQMPNAGEDGLKLSDIETMNAEGERARVTLVSRQTNKTAGAEARIRQSAGAACPAADRVAGGRAGRAFRVGPDASGATFEKLTLLTGGPLEPRASLDELDDFPTELDASGAAWEPFWDVADVRIEGDAVAQKAVRYALWSTRIAAPDDGGASSIGAKNLTGDWYRGAVFWDMEMYQLSLLSSTAPQLARNHIRYRHRRLDAARTLAAQDGYAGARFPWQSYGTGLEEPPVLGGFLYQQVHINVAAPWGVLQHYDLTGDDAMLRGAGLEVLAEQCRYWRSRITPGDDERGHILDVCGPDETHPGIDDNAYTNRMVSYVLTRSAELAAATDAETRERLGLDDAELARWRDAAETLHVPTLDGDVPATFAGYAEVPEPGGATDETGTAKTRNHKQADTLMLLQAIPWAFEAHTAGGMFDEYAPLCSQTSSLSLCSHALAAIRLGRHRDARKYFDSAARVDLADQYGNTRHGVHGAGEGGVWMAAVHGFGGLSATPDGVRVNPRLPPEWTRMAYGFVLRGQPIRVTVDAEELNVANRGSEPVNLTAAGQALTLGPAESVTIPHQPNWAPGRLEAVIFDLDGVLVSTDRFHYLAWKELADAEGLAFDETVNHRLRGVSRAESLRRIYEHNELDPPTGETFEALTDRKNARYVEYISGMTPEDILPGALELLRGLREHGVKLAVSSASRNTPLVLERTGLVEWFDAVIDGNCVTRSKPDPQGFTYAVQRLRALPWNCLGIEDAASGVEAIHRAGMLAVGVGSQNAEAELRVEATADLSAEGLADFWRRTPNHLNPYLERNIRKAAKEVQDGYAEVKPTG